MKKAIVFITVLCLLMNGFIGTVNAQALAATKAPPLTMQILGKKVSSSSPINKNGTIYIPLRVLGEQLGFLVSWDAKSSTMTLKKGNNTIKATVNSLYCYINGKKTKLLSRAKAIMYNSHLYVTIGFVQAFFNYTTTYDKTKNVVFVNNKKSTTGTSSGTTTSSKAIYALGKKLDAKAVPTIISDKLFIPLRALGEGLGYTVTWDAKTKTMTLKKGDFSTSVVIGKKTAVLNGKQVSLANAPAMYGDRCYVPLTYIMDYFNYDVDYDKGKLIVWVNNKIIDNNSQTEVKYVTANIQDISYDDSGGFPQLNIIADNPVKYSSLSMQNPDRLVIDISNAIMSTDFDSKEINKGGVIRVRLGQYTLTPEKTVRVVVDLENPKACKLVQSEDKKSISLIYANIIKPIELTKESGRDTITITGTENLDTNVYRVADPDRLVIDVNGAVLDKGDQTVQCDTSYLRSIRTGQVDVGISRVVLDLQSNVFYNVEKLGKTTKIYVSDAPFSFVDYDRYYNTAFAELSPGNEVEYQATADAENGILNILIPGDLQVEEKKYAINDNVIEYYEIKKEVRGDDTFTVASFKMKDMVHYQLVSPAVSSVIKIKFNYTPKTVDQLTILIDAGHGGKDPGAVGVGGSKEKDLNLDVANRLNSILQGLGFKTIMTRSDDSYVDLATRANTANNNFADFFMCIHFNAFNQKTQGIETLYYPNTKTEENPQDNWSMAAIFHNELVSKLGRPSRGITARPNLYVLNKTKMPAILAELGFITNPDEYAQIKTDQYKENAARALAVSIVKYFENMQGIKLDIDPASIYSAPMPGDSGNTTPPTPPTVTPPVVTPPAVTPPAVTPPADGTTNNTGDTAVPVDTTKE